jgi:hypothetical protein
LEHWGFKTLSLAPYLSADVVGYSRLMRNDEKATVRDLAAHRNLISKIIKVNDPNREVSVWKGGRKKKLGTKI